MQISEKWHAEVSDACAYDAECALKWAAERIKAGHLDEWVVCSCVSFARTLIPTMPHVDAKWYGGFPHSIPTVGSIAVLDYEGTYHVAVITSLDADTFHVKESNFSRCKIDERDISYSDPHLVSFWNPSPTLATVP